MRLSLFYLVFYITLHPYVLQNLGVYQPTRDLTRKHYAILAVIVDRLLAAASAPSPSRDDTAALAPAPAAAPMKLSKTQRKAEAARAGTEASGPADASSGGGSGDGNVIISKPYSDLRSLSTSLALCAVLDLDHR